LFALALVAAARRSRPQVPWPPMTLRLTIDERRWQAHVDEVRTSVTGLTPVVKGNGYGIGRAALSERALAWSRVLVMGTVHEALQHRRIADEQVLVLTPAVRPVALPSWVVPTVGRPEHLDAVAGHRGAVAVKLRSSMNRYGTDPEGLAALLRLLDERARPVHAALLHLPLPGVREGPAGGGPLGGPLDGLLDEVEAWLPHVPVKVPVSVSHVDATAMATLRERHPDRTFQVRLGTALWHGDKSFLQVQADVIDVHPVRAGARVGYRATTVAGDGTLVMVGAGSSHGIAPLDGGRSPFHFRRARIALVEAPHMHTSMCWVPQGQPAPEVGDWVDVQRPLIAVTADEVVWS